MRAVDFAMAVIFINCGFAIADAIGVFGSDISDIAGVFHTLKWLTNPYVMATLATIFATGTVVVLNTNAINDRGIAYTTFTALFWGSVLLTGKVVFTKIDVPGVELFYTIFCIAAALVFVNALIQMSTGGQKSHV